MKVAQRGLIQDLAILVKRHPSREWMKLARLLEDEHSRSKIVSFLISFSNLRDSIIGPNARENAQIETKPRTRHKKREGRSRNEIEKLKARLAQTSTSTLRDLASSVGVRVSPRDSRKRLLSRLLRTSKVALSILDKTPAHSTSLGRTNDYGQWATIILGKLDRKT
jgi:hypothetical protein